MTSIPILLNHNKDRPISFITFENEVTVTFNSILPINKQTMFSLFPGAGLLVTDSYIENDETFIKSARILEYSLLPEMYSI